MANWTINDIGQALSMFSEWDRTKKLNPYHKDGRQITGEFIKVAVGPPTLRTPSTVDAGSDASGASNIVMPIALAQGLNITTNIQQFTVYELGSKAEYNITGRSAIQIGFGAMYLYGPNLLRWLYGWKKDNPPTGSERWEPLWDVPDYYQDNWTIHLEPGNQLYWLNVWSDIFSRPVGLLLLIEDNTETLIAAPYLERCYVTAYGTDVDPNGIIVRENVTIIPHGMKYVEVGAMDVWDEIKTSLVDYLTGGAE